MINSINSAYIFHSIKLSAWISILNASILIIFFSIHLVSSKRSFMINKFFPKFIIFKSILSLRFFLFCVKGAPALYHCSLTVFVCTIFVYQYVLLCSFYAHLRVVAVKCFVLFSVIAYHTWSIKICVHHDTPFYNRISFFSEPFLFCVFSNALHMVSVPNSEQLTLIFMCSSDSMQYNAVSWMMNYILFMKIFKFNIIDRKTTKIL